MVAGKGEPTFIGDIFQPFHRHVHIVIIRGLFGEFHTEVPFFQVAVDVVLVDEPLEPVYDELGDFIPEAGLDDLVEVDGDRFVYRHG